MWKVQCNIQKNQPNQSSKVVENKVIVQKSVKFLYTNLQIIGNKKFQTTTFINKKI